MYNGNTRDTDAMRVPKHKTCAACLWYAAAKQTANGVIDGEFFCRHAANSHKSKGWGGRVHKNDRACENMEKTKN